MADDNYSRSFKPPPPPLSHTFSCWHIVKCGYQVRLLVVLYSILSLRSHFVAVLALKFMADTQLVAHHPPHASTSNPLLMSQFCQSQECSRRFNKFLRSSERVCVSANSRQRDEQQRNVHHQSISLSFLTSTNVLILLL